ncbi:hypothetical protein Tco_1157269 [Tanacetum coccineum]
MIGIGLRSGMLGVMVGRLMGWVVLFGSWVFGWLKGAAVLGSGVDSDASEVRRREGARSRKMVKGLRDRWPYEGLQPKKWGEGRYDVSVPALTGDHEGNKTNTPYPGKAIRRIQAIWE